MMIDVSSLFSLPEGLHVEWVEPQDAHLSVGVVSTCPSSCCPLCAQASSQVHSRYQRTLRDVPCGNRKVVLHLSVRKFFCRNPHCPRKIFTEQLSPFVEPWAQVTTRQFEAVQAIGLATSGELGTRLADRIRIHSSPTTILRRIMDLSSPAAGRVTVLGIDDFSFRRGRRFGTVLVDLSSHQVIDLLAERSTKSAADWMRQHPEIEYISRDRGNDYTQAAREGAPQAVSVADRFHLTKNLVEAIEPLIARCYKELRKEQAPLPGPSVPTANEWRQAPDADVERKRVARQVNKQERFEQVKAFLSQGLSPKEIAQRLAMPVRTVYRWQEREVCPAHQPQRKPQTDKQERFDQAKALRLRGLSHKEIAGRLAIGVRTVQRWLRQPDGETSQPRRKRRSIFDPYAPHVLARWQQGCRDIGLIFQEIQKQGFKGSIRTVYRFIRTLRQGPVELPAPSVLDRVSVQEALWLIVRPFDDLETDERTNLLELCQASSKLSTLHTLVQSFGQIVRKREGHRLEDWRQQVAESGLSEVQRFATGLERDKEAVLAGLTLVYSNGQVEGQVNKLKLLKRTMYGRADFPLLRQRVLHAL